MNIIRVGVDIAKNVFHVHGVDRTEKMVWQKKLKRSNWIGAIEEHLEPGTEIGMEACAGAHHWARELQIWRIDADKLRRGGVHPIAYNLTLI